MHVERMEDTMKQVNLDDAFLSAQELEEGAGYMRDLIAEVKKLRALRDAVAPNADVFAGLAKFYDDVHAANVRAGWWTDIETGLPKKRNVGEMFALIVTELAEAFRAYVNGDLDDKLPLFPGLGVELGDVQIRLADFMGALRAGRIVEHSNTYNPGENHFFSMSEIANGYEAIRKTPDAVGDAETGAYLPVMDPVVMIAEKLAFNAKREDHKIENRLKDDGKRT